jgi:hypothetical protein
MDRMRWTPGLLLSCGSLTLGAIALTAVLAATGRHDTDDRRDSDDRSPRERHLFVWAGDQARRAPDSWPSSTSTSDRRTTGA